MSLSGRELQHSAVFAKSNRKIIISTAFIGVILFAFFHKPKVYLDKLNSVEETACILEVINSPLTPQYDPCMISIIRKDYLLPPSTLPLNLSQPNIKDPSVGRSEKVLEILKNKKRGFFVEAGALDGETYSTTLFMERELEWEGLLVEANPDSFAKVVSKHRKAWLINAALSNSAHPKAVTFYQDSAPVASQIDEFQKVGSKSGLISVQCFPLYSILLALNRTTVDYFSLDVEGYELDVLRTIPWSKVDIKTLTVEFSHVLEGKEAVKKFMEGKGYTFRSEIIDFQNELFDLGDLVFVKNV